MLAVTHNSSLRLIATVSGRVAAFVALVGLSIPISAEFASFLPSIIPELGIPEGQFGRLVDDYVFDVAVNWPLLALAPMALIDTILGSLPDKGAIFWSCVGWAPIALAYAWVTRSRHLFFFALSIYPFVWLTGIGLRLLLGAATAT